LVALWYSVGDVVLGVGQATDFRFAYYPAAAAILEGGEFYPVDGLVPRGADGLIVDYVYPPLSALLTVPWTVLPLGAAEAGFVLFLVLASVGTLAVLGVRDWRCYGAAFLWLPLADGLSTGNVSVLLALAAAVAWRFRDRPLPAGASVAIGVATKVLLWPLVFWLAATRRVSAAAWSVALALAVTLASWAVVGFRGLSEYPDLAREVSERQDHLGYTVYALAFDLGAPSPLARGLWLGLGAALLAGTILAGRHGEDRRAFMLALAAAIALSPVVWLHYFSLLLVVVAVTQPVLGPLWFVALPLQVVVTTRVFNGSTFQTAFVLATAALVFALALRRDAEDAGAVLLSSPAARAR
jgi:alpha-1,2-mannosyltransferase